MYSDNQMKEDESEGACGAHGREFVQCFGREIGRKQMTWKTWRRYKNAIKIYLKEIWWGGIRWSHVADDRN
jgi:hypothetical protein